MSSTRGSNHIGCRFWITVPSNVFKSYILKKKNPHTYMYTLHIWPNKVTQARVTLLMIKQVNHLHINTKNRTEFMLPVLLKHLIRDLLNWDGFVIK